MTRTLTAVATFARARRARRDDAGDGTLSTVIIIAGFVTLAIVIVALVTNVANEYMSKIY
ncbi:MAG: hypothetical protein FWE61_06890 [Micrococcales bacterium]|nr:hypothetical protein [Micrococcales bacterium]